MSGNGIEFLNSDRINTTPVSATNPLPVALFDANGNEIASNSSGQLITPFSQKKVIAGSFTLAANYSAGQCVGGIITVACGIGNNQPCAVEAVETVDTATTMTTGLGNAVLVFGTSPAGTFTDTSTVSFAAGDGAKLIMALAQSSSSAFGNMAFINRGSGAAAPGSPPDYVGTTDGSGNLYLTWAAAGAPSYTGTATRAWRVQLRY